jgi:hypothetical protein
VLKQMTRAERISKLHQTFESVVDEYAGLTGVDVDDLLDSYNIIEEEEEEGEETGGSSSKAYGNGGPSRKMARLG